MPHYDYDNAGSIDEQPVISVGTANTDTFYVLSNENGNAVDIVLTHGSGFATFEIIRLNGRREFAGNLSASGTFSFKLDGQETVTLFTRVTSTTGGANGWRVTSADTTHGLVGSTGRGHTVTLSDRLTVASV